MTRMVRRAATQFRSLRRAAAEIARCWHRGALALALGLPLASQATSAFAQTEPVRGDAENDAVVVGLRGFGVGRVGGAGQSYTGDGDE